MQSSKSFKMIQKYSRLGLPMVCALLLSACCGIPFVPFI